MKKLGSAVRIFEISISNIKNIQLGGTNDSCIFVDKELCEIK